MSSADEDELPPTPSDLVTLLAEIEAGNFITAESFVDAV